MDAEYDMDVAVDTGDQRERCNYCTGGYGIISALYREFFAPLSSLEALG